MDPTLYQTRENLKRLDVTAPTPEARLLAQQALTCMKTALRCPGQEHERRRLSSLIELFGSLALCVQRRDPQLQADRDQGPEQVDPRLYDYYYQLGTELRTVEGFLDRTRRDPEPILFLLGAPHRIEESEEIWLALFRAVDLWEVRADLYKKCAARNGVRALHLEAFRWLDEAVHCPRGSGIDPAYWLVGTIARHPTNSADPQLQQEQRMNLAILRLIARAVLARLRKAWLAEYHPELLSKGAPTPEVQALLACVQSMVKRAERLQRGQAGEP
jgi:hypothetical protein